MSRNRASRPPTGTGTGPGGPVRSGLSAAPRCETGALTSCYLARRRTVVGAASTGPYRTHSPRTDFYNASMLTGGMRAGVPG
ncbi:hypothetical protein GCM10023215_11470 [Pseudonocardia yuanmonensis]|uniref:Uncharacterized protein n=1 Tax=Pseudonocardia yuanmonensis TaxID=1095914 RepID=A0ABP8W3L4_9PSEU